MNPTEISTFPNPTTGIFSLKIQSEEFSFNQLRITDMTGKVLMTKKLEEREHLRRLIEVDLNRFPSGVYIWQLLGENGIYSSKIIKQ